MTIETTTHLNFAGGRAREALDFYAAAFDGTATATTYGELGMAADAPDAGRVVFGRVESPAGLRLMAYDVPGAAGATAGG